MGAASPVFWSGVVQRNLTPSFTTDVRSLVESYRPDLLLAEFAPVAAMTTVKELCHVPLVMTAWASEPGPGAFFDDAMHGAVDEFRANHGLPPVLGGFPVDHWVVFTPPSWGRIPRKPLASTLRAHVPAVRSPGWSAPASAGPFVYGTLGTVYNSRRRLGTFVDAIGLGGWSGLVTVSRTIDPSGFKAWPSVAIEQFVPQAAVLERADVVVCHGGLGTVLGAIETATPMVIVPLGADQLANAEIARRLGVAMVVDPKAAGPEVLRDAIASVLASPSHRSACEALRDETMAMPAVTDLVGRLVAAARR